MRKIVSLALALLLAVLPTHVKAAEVVEKIEYLEDGSYIVTTIEESITRATGTKTASKKNNFYNEDDELQWTITVTGTFTYDGTSSTCTKATGTTTITNTTNWYLISESPTKSGNTATYTVTFGRKVIGITTSKPTYSVSLTCDANGNLS